MNVETLHRSLAKIIPQERTTFAEPDPTMIACLGDCVPRLTSSPQTLDEAEELIRFADREGLAVVPIGSASKLALGNRLEKGDIFLSTRSLEPTLEIQPDDLVAHVSSGTSLHELQSRARAFRLHLPLDPPDAHRATLGGIAATDSFGSLRTGCGRLRDYVIGMQVMTSRGERARSGGRVVKNVTGYDLMKLHLGGLGTLGLILDMDLRLVPLPDEDRTLLRGYITIENAWKDGWAIHEHPEIRAEAIEVFTTSSLRDQLDDIAAIETPFAMAIRLRGSPAAVSSRLAVASFALENATGDMWDLDVEKGEALFSALNRIRSIAEPGRHTLSLRTVLRASLMGSWLETLIEEPLPESPPADWLISPSLGLADIRVGDGRPWIEKDPNLDRFHGLARRFEGFLQARAAPLALRDQVEVLGPADNLSLHEAIKIALDPGGVFNPGRQLGGL